MRRSGNLASIQIKGIILTENQTILIRRIIVSTKNKISKRICDRFSFVDLDLLHYMRMVPNHRICTPINAVVPDSALCRIAMVGFLNAPMVVKDDQFCTTLTKITNRIINKFFCAVSNDQPTLEAKPIRTPFTVTIGMRAYPDTAT